jgi:hypothetical protein
MIAPARKALEKLTTLPGVTIAIVTGRAIDSVKRVAEPLNEWFLVGSHGIEVLSPGEVTNYETPWLVPGDLIKDFEAVVTSHPGTRLEHKPFGLALHTRGVEEQVARGMLKPPRTRCVMRGEAIWWSEPVTESWSAPSKRQPRGMGLQRSGDVSNLPQFFSPVMIERMRMVLLFWERVMWQFAWAEGRRLLPIDSTMHSAVAEALWFIHDKRASVDSGS